MSGITPWERPSATYMGNLESFVFQKHHSHFRIYGIVLYQQYSLSCEIIVRLLRFLFLFFFLTQRPRERRYQGRFEHRFTHQQVNSSQLCLMFDKGPVIGRHDNDCHLRAYNTPDSPCGFNSIHIRHFPVNQNHIIVFSLIPKSSHLFNGFPPAVYPLCFYSHFTQCDNRAFTDSHIIVYH